jgi:hypothetical protein
VPLLDNNEIGVLSLFIEVLLVVILSLLAGCVGLVWWHDRSVRRLRREIEELRQE